MWTAVVTVEALTIAYPWGLAIAVYLSEFAMSRTRRGFLQLLELMASVPTILPGVLLVLVILPAFQRSWSGVGPWAFGMVVGVMVGIMLVPSVAVACVAILTDVPRSLREGAFSLGASRFEVATRLALPSARSALLGVLLLTVAKAAGETVVVMLAREAAWSTATGQFSTLSTEAVRTTLTEWYQPPIGLAGLILFLLCAGLIRLSLRFRRRLEELTG